MFINNINPVLLKIGFLEIRYYGIVYVLGFILLYITLIKKRKKLKIKREQIDSLLLWLIIGLIIGARFFHLIFSDPLMFLKNPLELFMLWHGGMSFFGGLLGGFIALYLYIKKTMLEWKRFADISVIVGIFALALGRIANYINSEIVGTPSNLNWCVVFQKVDNICRHPYQLYASLSHFILFGILLFTWKKTKKPGIVFANFLIGYGLFRFITDFFRQDLTYFGLSIWQYMSLVLIIIGIVFLRKINKLK
ncbi:MAG: prolipoprotein diacylglyceryl transferase [Nanoarchaeota archaeon]|nr:prolipoprotein diacylglyceryl transferase [Nanoarchaeota archaeon]